MKYSVNSFEIDTVQFQIKHDSMPVAVEPKVFDLIVYLIENRQKLITREELFKQIWQGREVSDTTLSNSIKSARKILGDNGETQKVIKTIRGRGYLFVAEVHQTNPIQITDATRSKFSALQFIQLNFSAVIFIGFIIFFVLAWLLYQNLNSQKATERPYILVTPFELTGLKSEKWQPFANQMTKDVIRNLRKISGLHVIPSSSDLTFKGNNSHAYIKKQLPEVRYILSATINFWGDHQVQVISELEDLQTEKLVWDNEFQSRIDDTTYFSIKSKIATSLSHSLKVAVLEDEKISLGKLPTSNLQAYELYVKGQKYKDELTRASLLQAIELYSQAISLDPTFELAYIAKADAYRIIMAYVEQPSKILPKVIAAVSETLTINPNSAEARSSLGISYALAWRWKDAWEVLNQAKKLNPNLALTELGFALYYSGLGDANGVKRSLAKANQLDPLNIEIADWGHWSLAMIGELDEAIRWGKEKMSLHPNVGMIFSGASVSASLAGDHARAIALAEKGANLEVDSPYPLLALAQAYGYAGQTEKIFPLLVQAKKSKTYLCKYETAVTHLILNDLDKVFENLNQAVSDRSNCLVFTRFDPRLEPIRNDNRYKALLVRIGLDDKSINKYSR